MTDMTTTDAVLAAAPYNPDEDEDRISSEAFQKIAAGNRRAAAAASRLADGRRGFEELREVALGLLEAAEGAEVVSAIIDPYGDTDDEGDDDAEL